MTRTAIYALLIVVLAGQAGCRDGLLALEATDAPDAGAPDAMDETPGCFELFMVAPTPDVPYETRGMLTNLIVVEARSQGAGRDEPLDRLIERAAAEVTARFPNEAQPALAPHVDDAIADALDIVSGVDHR